MQKNQKIYPIGSLIFDYNYIKKKKLTGKYKRATIARAAIGVH